MAPEKQHERKKTRPAAAAKEFFFFFYSFLIWMGRRGDNDNTPQQQLVFSLVRRFPIPLVMAQPILLLFYPLDGLSISRSSLFWYVWPLCWCTLLSARWPPFPNTGIVVVIDVIIALHYYYSLLFQERPNDANEERTKSRVQFFVSRKTLFSLSLSYYVLVMTLGEKEGCIT